MHISFFVIFGLMTFFSLILLGGILYLILKPETKSSLTPSHQRKNHQENPVTVL